MVAVSLKKFFFFFKQKTAYEMSWRDWSSDVCSSDLDSSADKLIFNRRVSLKDGFKKVK